MMLMALWPGDATSKSASTPQGSDLTVSLLTCWPGREVYSLCGHEAIRIRNAEFDSVWNYGIFDFRKPNFVYRFVKGETDYMIAGYPFEYFLPEYRLRGSKVMEQRLNLTQDEARRLRARLQHMALPENREYRYNYLRDNCATRILTDLDSTVTSPIVYSAPTEHNTYRDVMRHYHKAYPWYQLGIDIALGSGLDHDITPRQEMFVPMEMYRQVKQARFADGRPLSIEETELSPEIGSPVDPPTPWYITPLFIFSLIFALTVILCIFDQKYHRVSRWAYALYFGACGVAGCVVAFLVFVSQHAATSPNLLILWLNPLQLIVPLTLWHPKARRVANVLMWADGILLTVMMVIWPTQTQSTNPALFPLMATGLILAASYVTIRMKYGEVTGQQVVMHKLAAAAKRKAPARNARKASPKSTPSKPRS